MHRRHLLQGAAATLATLGFSQLGLERHALRYANVLAQNTPRKRALLVGINDYISLGNSGWQALRGAVNDVDMQRELLVHRFGFQASDVICLKNQHATRQAILGEFEQLIQSTKPGDVVVFHFSGHGSTVDDPDRVFADNLNGTLVPVDSDFPPAGGPVNDITSGTLFLLISALQTENVTVVLDSCHSGGGVRGNLVIRSRPGQAELRLRGDDTAKLVANRREREYQQRLLAAWQQSQQKTRQDWLEQRRAGLAKGVALLAARRDQEAADATFGDDLHAGVFTYALTRYLWQQTRNQAMGMVVVATKAKTAKLLQTLNGQAQAQTPELQEKPNSRNQQQPTYFVPSFTARQTQAAEAVVTQVAGNRVQVLLNGVEPQVLEGFGKGAMLKLVDGQGRQQGTISLTGHRQGSTIEGRVTLQPGATIAPGAILQEQSRTIPADWSLRIGLHESLGQEAAIAQQQLPQMHQRIVPVPLLQQEVQYILGRMTPAVHDALRQRQVANLPAVGSLGLFYAGMEPLPESFGQPEESLIAAVQGRLLPKFKFLLAGRLLRLMLNPASTQLRVQAAVQVVGQQRLAAQAIAVRSGAQATPLSVDSSAHQIRVNQTMQIVVQNQQELDLNCAVVFLSADGEVLPLPFTSVVPAQTTISIPGDRATVRVQPPLGQVEVMVVFSTVPLDRAIAQLEALSTTRGDRQGDQAVAAVDTLLDDLSGIPSGTRSQGQGGNRPLRVDQMAVLSVTFEVVP